MNPVDWVGASFRFYVFLTFFALGMLYCLSITLCSKSLGIFSKDGTFPRTMCRVTLADNLVGLVYYPILSLSAFLGWWELNSRGTYESRWIQTTPASTMYVILFIAHEVLHVPVVILRKQATETKVQILLHHVCAVVGYGIGSIQGDMHFFAVLSGLSEITNVFLGNVMLLKELWPNGWGSACLSINGVILWLTFIFFRLALFPLCIYTWFTDMANAPKAVTGHVNQFVCYWFPLTITLLMILSCVWFVSITKGMMKSIKQMTKSSRCK